MIKSLETLAILIIIGSLTGCATPAPVCAPISLPSRPDLIATSQEIWDKVDPEAQQIWVSNDLSLKAYAKRLESRIKIHNDGCSN